MTSFDSSKHPRKKSGKSAGQFTRKERSSAGQVDFSGFVGFSYELGDRMEIKTRSVDGVLKTKGDLMEPQKSIKLYVNGRDRKFKLPDMTHPSDDPRDRVSGSYGTMHRSWKEDESPWEEDTVWYDSGREVNVWTKDSLKRTIIGGDGWTKTVDTSNLHREVTIEIPGEGDKPDFQYRALTSPDFVSVEISLDGEALFGVDSVYEHGREADCKVYGNFRYGEERSSFRREEEMVNGVGFYLRRQT